MEDKNINSDLMSWTDSLMSDRSIGLVIDTHHCTETGVETGVSQRSPVLPILFKIYLSRVFREMEKEVEG